MHYDVLVDLIRDFVGQGRGKTNSSQYLEEDIIIGLRIHGREQLDLYWLAQVQEDYLFGDDLIILAYVLFSDEDLLDK